MELNQLGLAWKETDYGSNHTCYYMYNGLILGRVSVPFTGTNYSAFINKEGVEKLYGNFINLDFAKAALVSKILQDVNDLIKEHDLDL